MFTDYESVDHEKKIEHIYACTYALFFVPSMQTKI